MQVKLKVLKGSNEGKEVKIPGPSFVIGRGEDCHLRPKSDAISRRHCEIQISDNTVLVRDLGSKNGTYINEDQIQDERELKIGNVLRVGRLEFEVIIEHVLGGAKKPKVADVKDAAVRSTNPNDSHFDDDDISGWLETNVSDSRSHRVADPPTKQYELDETDRMALDETSVKPQAEVESTNDAEADDEDPPEVSESTSDTGKKKPGKLPLLKSSPTTENSRQAAADMLKKFFNRT